MAETPVPPGSGGLRIVRPQRVPARVVWLSEAADFTPWLSENLDFLSDLGLGQLSLVQVEARLPGHGRSLDILAETSDGRRVAIENQYSPLCQAVVRHPPLSNY